MGNYPDMTSFFEHMLKEEDQWRELNIPQEDLPLCIGGFSEADMDCRGEPQSYDQIRGE